jgi:hypothetical protein
VAVFLIQTRAKHRMVCNERGRQLRYPKWKEPRPGLSEGPRLLIATMQDQIGSIIGGLISGEALLKASCAAFAIV